MNPGINYKLITPDAYISKKNIIKFVSEIPLKSEKFDSVLWRLKFPSGNIDFKRLKMTNIGLYSIAMPECSKDLVALLQEINLHYNFATNIKELIVTEANGGIGGFSIILARTIKHINIVEIVKEHSTIIKNNLLVYGTDLSTINIYNNDYLEVMNKLTQDIIIFDLPWNGPSYKQEKNLMLGMNNINIWYIINDLINNKRAKAYIILVPNNFDFQNFITNINSTNIFIKNLKKHFYIVVLNL